MYLIFIVAVLAVWLLFLFIYLRLKRIPRFDGILRDAFDIVTKIVYVKTDDGDAFAAYELDIANGDLQKTTFARENTPGELAAWLEADVLDFLAGRQWTYVRPVNIVKAETAAKQLFALCGFDIPSIPSGGKAGWCLHLLNKDNEGIFLVALDTKPQNFAEFESILAQLFE